MRGIVLIFLAIAISACQPPTSGLETVADKAASRVTCPNSEGHLFDVMYESLTQLKKDATAEEINQVFSRVIQNKNFSKAEKEKFLTLTEKFYLILQEVPAENLQEKLQKVAAAEVGLNTNDEEVATQKKLKAFQAEWKNFAAKMEVPCLEPQPEMPPAEEAVAINPVAWGARKAIATAYQSCLADEKKPMDANTQDVKGITITGTHPDGVGSKRLITDLDALMATNYYYQGSSQAANCKDPRKYPLIYDYGGKPNTDSGNLNFFLNAGDGTSVLGIDCSGFVFSSVATAGLRLAPGKTVKAVQVHGISSRAYLNPEGNGLTCFGRVKMGMSGTLKQGDIAAVNGHVLIVDSAGEDPLGIRKMISPEQCDSITAADFDFVISQSSSTKNGIGINKFEARDYLPLPDSHKMLVGFVKYAQDACRARLSGKDVQMTASNFQIVRHKMTSDCKTSTAIALAGESCIAQCPTLRR